MVSSCHKQIFLLAALICTSSAFTLDIVVLNDVSEIIRSKKISLRINFSPGEKFLYRDMLKFSSSNPKITLRTWKSFIAAKTEYIASFHQTKRIFVEPFDLELTFDGGQVDDTTLAREISQTNVLFSYVVLTHKNAHQAKTAVIPVLQVEKTFSIPTTSDVSTTTLTTQKNSINIPPPIDDEISYLQQGEAFYHQLGNLAHRIKHAYGWLFLLCMLLLGCLLGTWRLCKKYHTLLEEYYPKQFGNIVLSCTPIALTYVISACGGHGFASIMLGSYAMIIGCYLLISQHGQPQTLKTKALSLFGGICCVSALPLIVRGLLIMMG